MLDYYCTYVTQYVSVSAIYIHSNRKISISQQSPRQKLHGGILRLLLDPPRLDLAAGIHEFGARRDIITVDLLLANRLARGSK